MNTIEKINENTKSNNEAFRAMTAAEKRVHLAKDVIKLLKAEKIIANTGRYVRSFYWNGKSSIQETLCELENCEVCVKGALFYSRVSNYNEWKPLGQFSRDLSIQDPDVEKALDGIFSKDQLDLMEAAFEGWVVFSSKENELNCIKATNMYHNSDNRKKIFAIMHNIIRNNGGFCLPKR